MGTTAVRTAKRLLLGKEIKHAIDKEGLTQALAADLIKVRPQKMTDILSGRAAISYAELVMLAQKLGLDEDHTKTLEELHQDSNKRGFWSTGYNRAYHEDFRLMVDLERTADLLRCLESEIAPDLTQSEAYVRALFEAYGGAGGQGVEDWVHARLQRQEVLVGDDPLQYHVVFSESSLRRQYGSPAVMREQLSHMIKLSKWPNVLLQVVPFKVETVQVTSRPFMLVRVPSPGVAGPLELGYIQGEKEIRYIDDKKALSAYENTWSRLTATALNATETRQFMRFIEGTFKEGA